MLIGGNRRAFINSTFKEAFGDYQEAILLKTLRIDFTGCDWLNIDE